MNRGYFASITSTESCNPCSGKTAYLRNPNFGKEIKEIKINGIEYLILGKYTVTTKINNVDGSLDIKGNFIKQPYKCVLGRKKNKQTVELIKVGKNYKTIDQFVNKVNNSKGKYRLELVNGFNFIQFYDIIKK